MARSGEILNKGVLQSIARALNIGGVGQFPTKMNLDQIQMVAPVSNPLSAYEIRDGLISTNAVVGVNTFSSILVGNSDLGATNPLVDTRGNPAVALSGLAGKEARLISASMELFFDAAGAAAFAGKTLTWAIRIIDNALTRFHTMTMGQFSVIATRIEYQWDLRGGNNGVGVAGDVISPACSWSGWVPPSYRVYQELTVEDGTVFPANTVLFVDAIGATTPQGTAVPN